MSVKQKVVISLGFFLAVALVAFGIVQMSGSDSKVTKAPAPKVVKETESTPAPAPTPVPAEEFACATKQTCYDLGYYDAYEDGYAFTPDGSKFPAAYEEGYTSGIDWLGFDEGTWDCEAGTKEYYNNNFEPPFDSVYDKAYKAGKQEAGC